MGMKDSICNENTGKLTDSKSDQERLVMCSSSIKDYEHQINMLKFEVDIFADQMNTISNLVTGNEEAGFPEIIQGIAHFKSKAYKHEMNEKVEALFYLIDDLAEAKDEVINNT